MLNLYSLTFSEENKKCLLHLLALPCTEFPYGNQSCSRTGADEFHSLGYLGNIIWGLAAVNQACSQNRPTLPGKSRAELVVLGSNLFLSGHSYEPRLRESLA